MSNKKITIFIFCLALLSGFIYFIATEKNSQVDKETVNLEPPQNETQNKNLESRASAENGLSIEVVPLNFEPGKAVSFQITFNTHGGELDFDVAEISVLNDDMGNEYQPLEWQGGRGGHHLEGLLVFPPLPVGAKNIKLIIKGVYDVPERVFEWNLN